MSVLEAASWRLASELVRRHPQTLRILRTHPGDGQYDCLTITMPDLQGGTIQLNRNGTIQVQETFGRVDAAPWEPTDWDEYLRDDPRSFLVRLEAAAGLQAPLHVPSATALTLTYRSLAALTATAVKSVHPIMVHSGYFDTSGYDAGPNALLDAFTGIPQHLRDPRRDDLFGEPGYRFWIVTRNEVPILAIEQVEGLAWSTHHIEPINLIHEYQRSRRSINVTALELLRRADNI